MPISNHIKPPHSKTYQTKSNQKLPSGYVKIAIENDHRNSGCSHLKWWIFRPFIVDFLIKNGGSFHSYALNG